MLLLEASGFFLVYFPLPDFSGASGFSWEDGSDRRCGKVHRGVRSFFETNLRGKKINAASAGAAC
jgi:hypothetical protein